MTAMIRLELIRAKAEDYGVFGVMVAQGFHAMTMELPELHNQPDVSCIPAGTYRIERDHTGKHRVYRLLDVPGRTGIEIHVANYVQELNGCIALGKGEDAFNGHRCLIRSRDAIQEFLEIMGDQPGELLIRWA